MKVDAKNVKKIIKEIAPAKLVAATKYVGIEEIHELETLGVKIFGENRVQALLDKYDKYEGKGEFHMIGTLQSNKVKYIIDKVSLIHSVDRKSLLEEIQKQAKKHHITMPVLLQVNIANEETKHGFKKEELLFIFDELKKYTNVEVKGLMMMAPNDDLQKIEKYFKETRELLDDLQIYYPNLILNQLSMGMSNDYQLAVKHSATLIRIGSILYNEF
jgi:pyridoxal phosphate enzyme, YggS family